MGARVLALVGPTGVGKSAAALAFAQTVPLEIVSADSMQVYRHMDIGTGKPSPADQARVAHHLIDIVEPSESYSVARYQADARRAIEDICQRGRLPVLVGGSGLYVRAVLDPLDFPRGVIDSDIRGELEERAAREGVAALYSELQTVDAAAAGRIHPNNVRRIIRALEVISLTGRLFSEYQQRWNERRSIYEARLIGLTMPRQELYAKINERVDAMIARGLVDEVKGLAEAGYGRSVTARQALGYKEILEYLSGRATLTQAVEQIKRRTRHFARRQLTWFRQDPRVTWIDVGGKDAQAVASAIRDRLVEEGFMSHE